MHGEFQMCIKNSNVKISCYKYLLQNSGDNNIKFNPTKKLSKSVFRLVSCGLIPR